MGEVILLFPYEKMTDDELMTACDKDLEDMHAIEARLTPKIAEGVRRGLFRAAVVAINREDDDNS